MDKVFYKATDIPTRAIVVTLKGLENFSSSKVAEITGINSRTVDRIYKKARDRGFDPTVFPVQLSIEHLEDSARTGRIGKRSDELYNVITDKIKKREEDGMKPYKCLELSNELKQEGFDVSKTTVWRALQNQRFKNQNETEGPNEEAQSGKKRKKTSKKLEDKSNKKQKSKKISEIKIEASETQEIIQSLQPGQQINESTSIGLNLPSSILDTIPDNLQTPEIDMLQAHNPAPNIIEPIPDTDSYDEEESTEELQPEPSLPEQLKESILKDVLDTSTYSPLSHALELNSPVTPPVVKLQRADESVQDIMHTSQSTLSIPETLKESTSNDEQDLSPDSPLLHTLELNPSVTPLISRLHEAEEPLVESQDSSHLLKDVPKSITKSTLRIVQDQAMSLQPAYEPETNLPKPLSAIESYSKNELIQELEHISQPISDASNSMDESSLVTAQDQIIRSQTISKTTENESVPHQDTEILSSKESVQGLQNASLPALHILEPSIETASSTSNDLITHTPLVNVSELNPSENLLSTELYSTDEPTRELHKVSLPKLDKPDQVNKSIASITQEKITHNPPMHEPEMSSFNLPSVAEKHAEDVSACGLLNISQSIPDISEPVTEIMLNSEQDSNTPSKEPRILELNLSESLQVDDLQNKEENDQETQNTPSFDPNASEASKDNESDNVQDLLKNW